jgi:cysteine desulfurase
MKFAMRVYLDYNATTPVLTEVAEAVARATCDLFGNPSSVHHHGQQAKAALDDARGATAALIGAEPTEMVLTGGGTEADNLAIRGVAEAIDLAASSTGRVGGASRRRHLVSSAIEHEAVLNTLKALARRGWRTTLVPVDASGLVSPEALRAALAEDTALVSVMHANNEIGTIQPITELAAVAHERGALFHTDAVQSAGKVPIDVRQLGIDLLALSAHKFNGPKGAGALWIRRGTRLLPILTGGKHERNRRAGTENVPAIVGMGVAASAARGALSSESVRVAALRDRLEAGILRRIDGTGVNGAPGSRVPNTTNISFDRIEAESLLIALDLEGVSVSTGSACSSGTLEPSHVLRAMGFSAHRTQNSLRFSLGHFTTEAEVDRVLDVLPGLVEKLRSLTRRPGAPAVARS